MNGEILKEHRPSFCVFVVFSYDSVTSAGFMTLNETGVMDKEIFWFIML
jgi:hypothetical protein